MDIFFEATVLVAASEHNAPRYAPRYAQARHALLRGAAGAAAHSSSRSGALLTENILPHFEVVSVSRADYLEVLNTLANGGWTGAKIYNAVLLHCAAIRAAERITPL